MQTDHSAIGRTGAELHSRGPLTTRPKGAVVWGHATRAEHVRPLQDLAERLRSQNPDCTVLITGAGEADLEERPENGSVIATPLPSDNSNSIEAFLEFWQPDYVIWTAGHLKSAFVDRIARRNIPMGLVAAESSLLATSTWRWLKGFSRSTLARFDCVFTLDAASLRDVEQLNLETVHVALGGPFVESAASLPYREAERSDMAGLLLGRPIWLAAHVNERELPTILDAHRRVIRFSHRALLILTPDQGADLTAFMTALDQCGLQAMRWSEGETPGEATQIVFADTAGELGLWYRLAPISFMGNSLLPGMAGSDPNEPAAHGSAIIHGPYLDHWAESYSRFTEASAAKQVKSAEALATSVARLIQPDQCAAMAHTAWEVASRGSALMDTIAERVLDHIDRAGRRG
ncbi:MAG: glycosyltransferase N-terminal domain-containing protein [Pseudomonadota bacterium]